VSNHLFYLKILNIYQCYQGRKNPSGTDYESVGRKFESCRARHLNKGFTALRVKPFFGYTVYRNDCLDRQSGRVRGHKLFAVHPYQ